MKSLWVRIMAVSAVMFSFGFAVRGYTRPSAEELAFQAGTAWNDGQVESAERLARLALSQNADLMLARDVLIQVSQHDNRPLLEVAVVLTSPAPAHDSGRRKFAAAERAFSAQYAAVATELWQDSLGANPKRAEAWTRLTSLASMQLHHERVMSLTQEKANTVGLTESDLKVLLSSETLVRDSATLLPRLLAYLRTDPTDVNSRIAVARGLIIAGDSESAIKLLAAAKDSVAAQTVIALAECQRTSFDRAAELLPVAPAPDYEAEYWHAKALLAAEKNSADEAITAFRKAIKLRPLSRELRADFGRVLRLMGREAANREQATAQQVLLTIHATATNPYTSWNQALIEQLSQQCAGIGAEDHARLLDEFQATKTSDR